MINSSIAMLQQIKQLGGDIDIPDRQGQTPLFHAVRLGDIDTIRELIRLGANLNKHNKAGALPILVALFNNDKDTFAYLLELVNAVHITFFYDRFSLLTLVHNAFIESPKKLIDLINSKPAFSAYTLEEFAAALENQAIFDLLTQNKFNTGLRQTGVQKYRPTAGFRLFDPDIATKLLRIAPEITSVSCAKVDTLLTRSDLKKAQVYRGPLSIFSDPNAPRGCSDLMQETEVISGAILIKENRWGNIEARHTSDAAQEEYDKAYGLVVSKPHLF